eukprot:TRINITY_DN24998_c0_g1_i1.p1 TRINITY_DN24998_c0_g1~~TRINITY_DN24998_c0_g1_i1.p1  ORF type:complete len:375 (+),score=98.49 TRINITY_DN24998_c0_g1_i1:79-1203(+)
MRYDAPTPPGAGGELYSAVRARLMDLQAAVAANVSSDGLHAVADAMRTPRGAGWRRAAEHAPESPRTAVEQAHPHLWKWSEGVAEDVHFSGSFEGIVEGGGTPRGAAEDREWFANHVELLRQRQLSQNAALWRKLEELTVDVDALTRHAAAADRDAPLLRHPAPPYSSSRGIDQRLDALERAHADASARLTALEGPVTSAGKVPPSPPPEGVFERLERLEREKGASLARLRALEDRSGQRSSGAWSQAWEPHSHCHSQYDDAPIHTLQPPGLLHGKDAVGTSAPVAASASSAPAPSPPPCDAILAEVRALAADLTRGAPRAPDFLAEAKARLLEVQRLVTSAQSLHDAPAREAAYARASHAVHNVRRMMADRAR